MPRKPSPERLAELQTYLGFFRAMWTFLERLHPELRRGSALPDGTSYGEFAAAWAENAASQGSAPLSALLTGTKQAVADQLEMTRDLPLDTVKLADESLVAAGAVSLTEMRRRAWHVIPKVLGRGRIRNLDEFYVVKNVLDDDGEELSKRERTRLDRMRFEFEARSAPGRKAPTGPGPARARSRVRAARRPKPG